MITLRNHSSKSVLKSLGVLLYIDLLDSIYTFYFHFGFVTEHWEIVYRGLRKRTQNNFYRFKTITKTFLNSGKLIEL